MRTFGILKVAILGILVGILVGCGTEPKKVEPRKTPGRVKVERKIIVYEEPEQEVTPLIKRPIEKQELKKLLAQQKKMERRLEEVYREIISEDNHWDSFKDGWYTMNDDTLFVFGKGKIGDLGDLKCYDWITAEQMGSLPYSLRSLISVVILQNGITNISEDLFHHCGELHTVFVPNTVVLIEKWAFDFSGLQYISPLNKDIVIEEGAFCLNDDLPYIIVGDTIIEYNKTSPPFNCQ